MKRYVSLIACCASLAGPTVHGQDSAVAIAARQEAEERYKALSGRVENIEESLQAYQRRLDALVEELRAVRAEIARLSTSDSITAATQKSLENLAEAIKEVDRKRLADNEKVLKALDEIRQGVTDQAAAPVRPNAPKPGAEKERGYEYTVQSGDNPYIIANKLARLKVKVTAQQIIDANPGQDWRKLQIGQKLFIPSSDR